MMNRYTHHQLTENSVQFTVSSSFLSAVSYQLSAVATRRSA